MKKLVNRAAWLIVAMIILFGSAKTAEIVGYPQVSEYLTKQADAFAAEYRAAKDPSSTTVISPTSVAQ